MGNGVGPVKGVSTERSTSTIEIANSGKMNGRIVSKQNAKPGDGWMCGGCLGLTVSMLAGCAFTALLIAGGVKGGATGNWEIMKWSALPGSVGFVTFFGGLCCCGKGANEKKKNGEGPSVD